jgi:ADP-heptose:LPS heptosyltransferase
MRRPASRPRKLILKNAFALGDIVMLTAAVRDLHACYPRRFLTDVRTSCAEIWENNPHLTPLSEEKGDATILECHYPLINRSNEQPYHCLHGFIEFLNETLKLAIHPTAFHGDLHISPLEKSWYSQVHEITGEDTPFWLIAAGGKRDVTIKWWSTERYQEVVSYFRGRIQFVQVGLLEDHHPPLDGVIDLRGKTSLRQLIRLVYHAQGVLCGVTGLMHLAAAIERRDSGTHDRPCVVVAGAREPAHWEAYPAHQFIHTNGMLPCAGNGCWRSRVKPLGDGDERDAPENLCSSVVGELPRCMDMISATEVIRRIEGYFHGGAARYLIPEQAHAAVGTIAASTWVQGFSPPPLNGKSQPRFSGSNSPEQLPGRTAKPPLLTLVTLADQRMTRLAQITGERLEEYSRRHGYACIRYRHLLDPARHPAWNKVLAVRHAMLSRQGEWVMWIDADAIIMNMDFPAIQLIQDGCDAIFASDFNGLSSGVFLLRDCEWSQCFLEATWFLGDLKHDPDEYGPKWDQNTFKHLLFQFSDLARHVAILPPRSMNSYLGVDYEPGDFILHLGGMTNEQRWQALTQLGLTPAPDTSTHEVQSSNGVQQR